MSSCAVTDGADDGGCLQEAVMHARAGRAFCLPRREHVAGTFDAPVSNDPTKFLDQRVFEVSVPLGTARSIHRWICCTASVRSCRAGPDDAHAHVAGRPARSGAFSCALGPAALPWRLTSTHSDT